MEYWDGEKWVNANIPAIGDSLVNNNTFVTNLGDKLVNDNQFIENITNVIYDDTHLKAIDRKPHRND
jgi:hypothetical protein